MAALKSYNKLCLSVTKVNISEKFFYFFVKKDLINLQFCNILLPQGSYVNREFISQVCLAG